MLFKAIEPQVRFYEMAATASFIMLYATLRAYLCLLSSFEGLLSPQLLLWAFLYWLLGFADSGCTGDSGGTEIGAVTRLGGGVNDGGVGPDKYG